jgi:hypothetical protein
MGINLTRESENGAKTAPFIFLLEAEIILSAKG